MVVLVLPKGCWYTEEIAEVVFLNVFRIGFSAYPLSNMLFDQEFPIHAVAGSGLWHKHTQTDIITYRLKYLRGTIRNK